MIELIRPGLVDAGGRLFEEYDAAHPFRHLVFEEFFSPGFAEALIEHFPAFDPALAKNENGEIGAKCVHENLPALGGPFRRLDALIQSREFLDWLGGVTGIDGLCYDPDYFGGGTHENRHGQDLDPHVDFNKHPASGLHRRLNLIVYLNHDWHEDWGGAIEFHTDPRLPPGENEIKYIQPRFNRAVLFETTHWSWHGFERIHLPGGDADPRSRKSVALYFYSPTRPAEEMTKPHSTIYVERPLPDDIRPGRLLSEHDYERIRVLLARRDQHLQRLYRNISDLSARIEDLATQRDRAAEGAARLSPGQEDAGPRNLIRRARRWLGRRLLG